MPLTFLHGLRAGLAAVVLGLAVAQAADQKEASPMGLTRDQVIARFGEPKSQMVVGNRTIMFFARDRLVLRDGVVVEAEKLAAEPRRTTAPAAPAPTPTAPPSTTAPAAPTPAAPSSTAAPAAAETTPKPAPPVERTGAAGAVPAAPTPAAPAASATAVDALDPNAPPAAGAPKSEPTLEIKSVRPPSANYTPRTATPQPTRPAPRSTAPASSEPVAPAPVTTASVPAAPSPARSATELPSTTSTPTTPPATENTPTVASTPTVKAPPVMPAPAAANVEEPAAKTEDEAKAEASAADKKQKDKKLQAVRARRRIAEAGDPDEPELAEAFLTTRTLVISFVVVAAGAMYLLWRNRQRQLLLSATALSHSPFAATIERGGDGGTAFTPELLAKFEWKRFEELVADYYAKTGVVAVRTKTGPASPVHIKISWKGEPRPFACVQCLAHPTGLIDAKPLQELMNVLTAEDIRRGYVVSSGKFGVSARDFAEEKHLTLLPGDIFLEKLNALPESARSEIMQAVTSGDYQTPSCPKCEAKMVKSSDNPGQWRCLTHPDQVIPVWQ